MITDYCSLIINEYMKLDIEHKVLLASQKGQVLYVSLKKPK